MMNSTKGDGVCMKTYGAIILAAGKGSRFEEAKQFFELDGKPLWRHVLEKTTFLVGSDNTVVVGVDFPGGETRSGSVMLGLKRLRNDTERVIILEAARPLVTTRQIARLLEHEHPSVTFVMPLVNTVVGRDGTYLDRDTLWESLTPQAFDYGLLAEAYESGRFVDMTDETRVMFEYHNIKPCFILGGQNLIKMTYKRDIPLFLELYRQQSLGVSWD